MTIGYYFPFFIQGMCAGFILKLMVDMIFLAINGIYSIFRKMTH